jgi:hypothetical protein
VYIRFLCIIQHVLYRQGIYVIETTNRLLGNLMILFFFNCKSYNTSNEMGISLPSINTFFFNFPLYLQTVPIHSPSVLKSYTKTCRRVLTSTLLYLIGSESSCDLGSETLKLNLKNYIYNYNIYIVNLVGRSIGKFFRNRLVSGRFKISSSGCTLRRLLWWYEHVRIWKEVVMVLQSYPAYSWRD